jgi:hypothetical protein
MFDVIFLSCGEPNREENWSILRKKCPWAKRVHGVIGIVEAHQEAARTARTENFFVVDGDSRILDDFTFRFKPPKLNRTATFVWRAQNAVNDLIYGYGGIKLFPRKAVLEVDPNTIVDFTTSVGSHFIPKEDVASVTAFNTGPFESWKSGFREATKLASRVIRKNIQDENEKRLDAWCSIGSDKPYGEYCIQGACDGREFGLVNQTQPEQLKLINDFNWLRERFEKTYGT